MGIISNSVKEKSNQYLRENHRYPSEIKNTVPQTEDPIVPVGSVVFFEDSENNFIKIKEIYTYKQEIPISRRSDYIVLRGENDEYMPVRIYGLTGQNSTIEGDNKSDIYGDYQKDAVRGLLQAHLNNGDDIILNFTEDNFTATVSFKPNDGEPVVSFDRQYDDAAHALIRNGVFSLRDEVRTRDLDGLAGKVHLADAQSRAIGEKAGIWKYQPVYNNDQKRKAALLQAINNSISSGNKRTTNSILEENEFIIGDVSLRIPPINIHITQMRNAVSHDILGLESKSTPSPYSRVVFKVDVIFNGAGAINNDLRRILYQYVFCPINIIRSKDLFYKLANKDSILFADYKDDFAVPVTMDSFILWNVDGNPNALGMTMQFSFFNYVPYFFETPGQRLAYFKLGSMKPTIGDGNVGNKEIKDANLKVESNQKTIDTLVETIKLEEAIHPYNLFVETLISDANDAWEENNSLVTIAKISKVAAVSEKLTMANMESGDGKIVVSDIDSDISNSALIVEELADSAMTILCTGVTVSFSNNFAWQPILGHTYPVAQYIGPGDTVVTVNCKTNENEIVNKLSRIYNSTFEKGKAYDDRYLILSSMTSLTRTQICSIRDLSISSLNGKPGWMDINIILTKSTYGTSIYESNPFGEQDTYWGLNRLFAFLQDEELLKKLEAIQKAVDNGGWKIIEGKDYISQTLGNGAYAQGLLSRTRGAINKVLGKIQSLSITNSCINKIDGSKGSLDNDVITFLNSGYFIGSDSEYRNPELLSEINIDGKDLLGRIKIIAESRRTSEKAGYVSEIRNAFLKSLDGNETEKIRDGKNKILNDFDEVFYSTSSYGYKLRNVFLDKFGLGNSEKFATSTAYMQTKVFANLYEANKDFYFDGENIKGEGGYIWASEVGNYIIDTLRNNNQLTIEDIHKYWNSSSSAFNGGMMFQVEVIGSKQEATLVRGLFSVKYNIDAKESGLINAFSLEPDTLNPWPKFFVTTTEMAGSVAKVGAVFIDESNNALKGWVEEDADSTSEAIEKMKEDLRKYEEKVKKTKDLIDFQMPFSGHRYYPGISSFVKGNAIDSSTVGDWFYHKYYNSDNAMLHINSVGEDAASAISPFKNTEAFKSVYFEKKNGSQYIDILNEDPYNPMKVMEAFCYPDLKMQANQYSKTGELARLKGNKIDTRIGVVSTNFMDREDDEFKSDVPFSSLSHLLLAKNYFGISEEVVGRYKNKTISLKQAQEALINNVMQQQRQTVSSAKNNIAKRVFDGNCNNVLKPCVDGSARMPSERMYTSISSIVEQSVSDSGIINGGYYSPIPNNSNLEACRVNMEICGCEKDAQVYDEINGLNNKIGENKVSVGLLSENNDKYIDDNFSTFAHGILKARAQGELDITEEDIKDRINELPAPLVIETNEAQVAFKNALDPRLYRFITVDDVMNYYLRGKIQVPINDIVARAYGIDISDLGDDLSKDGRYFLSQQYMYSQQSTIGACNAFPTYKVYVIESDLSDIKYFSLDDYYDFRLMQDMMIVRDKENPSHLFRGRIVVDERYVSLIPGNFQNSRRLLSGEREIGAPPPGVLDTQIENSYLGAHRAPGDLTVLPGKLFPFREGMRLCVKMGYHTDPRNIDTLFIGTIISISPTDEPGVYEVEARGDGRELTVPPTEQPTQNISGEDFAEIIRTVLNGCPSVVHFGKTYGGFLEKLSRKHYAIFAWARYATTSAPLWAPGFATGTVGSLLFLARFGSGMTLVAKGLTTLGISGASAYANFIAAQKYTNLGKSYSNFVKLDEQEENLMSQTYAGLREGWGNYWAEGSIGTQVANKWSEVVDLWNGKIYSTEMASRNVAKILYETFRRNNNPIDDNIFAVNMWPSIWHSTEMQINNRISIWDMLVQIKRCYPNFALDVRPYGSRSTLFLGPMEFNYWRTDDPVTAMAPQLHEISGNAVGSSMDYNEILRGYSKRTSTGMLADIKQSGSVADFVPFQKHHIASSDSDIIANNIRCTPDRGWNFVNVAYSKDGESDSEPPVIPLGANNGIDPSARKIRYELIDWTSDADLAAQYAVGLLKEGVEKLYGGSIVLRGNYKIEPYDRVFICDKVNQMYGWIQVETVIHKFDSTNGYTTHIVPNMVCSVNSDAYTTTAHILRRQVSKYASEMGVRGLIFAGLGYFAVSALSTFTLGLGAIGIFAIASVLHTAYTSAKKIGQISEKYNTGNLIDKEARFIHTAVPDAAHSIVEAKVQLLSYTAGGALGLIKNGAKAYKDGKVGDGWATTVSQSRQYFKTIVSEKFAVIEVRRLLSEYKKAFPEKYAALGSILDGDPDTFKSGIRGVISDLTKTSEKAKGSEERKKAKMRERSANRAVKIVDDALKRTGSTSVSELGTKELKAAGENVAEKTKGLRNLAFVAWLTYAIEMIPLMFEGILMKATAHSNIIVAHPLWYKNSFMMVGLEGYKNQDSIMHLGDMVAYTKDVFGEIGNAVNDWNPNLLSNASSNNVDKAFNVKDDTTREQLDKAEEDLIRKERAKQEAGASLADKMYKDYNGDTETALTEEEIDKLIDMAIDQLGYTYYPGINEAKLTIKAIAFQESTFRPGAQNGESHGLMQVQRGSTAAASTAHGIEINYSDVKKPYYGILAGAGYYLSFYIKHPKLKGSKFLSLCAYHSGPAYALAAQKLGWRSAEDIKLDNQSMMTQWGKPNSSDPRIPIDSMIKGEKKYQAEVELKIRKFSNG